MTRARAPAPRKSGRQIVVACSALLLGAALAARLSCASRPDADARGAGSVAPAPSIEVEQPPIEADRSRASEPSGAMVVVVPSRTNDPATPTSSADAPVTAAAAAPSAPASSNARARVAPHAVPRVDARELSLLAHIERELSRDPPPEVHGLLAEYRRGGDHAALVEYVQRKFPQDLPLRVLALRWIDDVRPSDTGRRKTRPRAPGRGTGPSWVAPIEKKKE